MKKISLLLTLVGVVSILLAGGAVPVYAQEEHHEIMVTIDVKPGGYPNPINLKSGGVIPVALLGSATFDVTGVNLGTVGIHPMERPEEAVAPVRYAFSDVNNDGYMDIIFHFMTQETSFQPGDTAACLHGELNSGEHFCGHNTVVIIGY